MGVVERCITSTRCRLESARLERVFSDCFPGHGTRLEGGFEEPLYLPPGEQGGQAVIRYRANYFASALHEVAHWCIAGESRRRQLDYGYWYSPDGRDAEQQAAFETVEDKPQALEWFFALACGSTFRISADNLDGGNGEVPDHSAFGQRVFAQARYWQRAGLPPRAALFYQALCQEFGTSLAAGDLELRLAELS